MDWDGRLDAFVAETDRVFDLLDGVMPEIAWLDDSQTLTYLHATVSTRRYRIGVPEVPFHLDALLADSALVGGLAPMLGDQHLRVVSVRGFPTSTWPGLLDDLNRLGFAYRWSTRFLCMDKAEAEKELGRLRRQWFAKRKNVVALLRETIFQQESPLVDTDASNKAADADAAFAGAWQRSGRLRLPDGDRHRHGCGRRHGRREAAHGGARHPRARVRHHSRNAERRRCVAVLDPWQRLRTCASPSSRR